MKTTRQHFDKFQEYVGHWQKELGLVGWKIFFRHSKTNDAFAQTSTGSKASTAVITLCTSWPVEDRPLNDTELKNLALHECLHVLLDPLYNEAQARYADEFALDKAEETIVKTLEQVLGAR